METFTVKIGTDKGNLAFDPQKLTAAPGDTIEWVCNKVAPHNVVFEASGALTEDLARSLSRPKMMLSPGQKQTTVIPLDTPPGEYRFHCAPHRGAGERGTLTIHG
ncbi:plastocyanin [Streptomyces sp. NPDC053367]|uniref:plastocyanin n=1 Tax=Streptomyces sp. NPDC053367 TaxID=3365700 RepID=UPI0037CFD733